MIDTVLFDWGGVLAESDSVAAGRRLALVYQVPQRELSEFMRSIQEEYSIGENSEEFLTRVSERFGIPQDDIRQAVCDVSPNGIFDIARGIKRNGTRVMLVSNQKQFKGEHLLRYADIGFFDHIFFSYRMGVKKPNPDFWDFVESKGIDPSSTLVVDDVNENLIEPYKRGFFIYLFRNPHCFRSSLNNMRIRYD
ncbi:MAG: HAD family hydrolase [Candidatus Woesearchaeota archaeon]